MKRLLSPGKAQPAASSGYRIYDGHQLQVAQQGRAQGQPSHSTSSHSINVLLVPPLVQVLYKSLPSLPATALSSAGASDLLWRQLFADFPQVERGGAIPLGWRRWTGRSRASGEGQWRKPHRIGAVFSDQSSAQIRASIAAASGDDPGQIHLFACAAPAQDAPAGAEADESEYSDIAGEWIALDALPQLFSPLGKPLVGAMAVATTAIWLAAITVGVVVPEVSPPTGLTLPTPVNEAQLSLSPQLEQLQQSLREGEQYLNTRQQIQGQVRAANQQLRRLAALAAVRITVTRIRLTPGKIGLQGSGPDMPVLHNLPHLWAGAAPVDTAGDGDADTAAMEMARAGLKLEWVRRQEEDVHFSALVSAQPVDPANTANTDGADL